MNTLEKVRAKITEAVPEIAVMCLNCREDLTDGKHKYGPTRIGNIGCSKKHIHYRPITLADVLRALPPCMYIKTMGENVRLVADDDEPGVVYWDLTLPSLDEQEPHIVEFIGKVLGV